MRRTMRVTGWETVSFFLIVGAVGVVVLFVSSGDRLAASFRESAIEAAPYISCDVPVKIAGNLYPPDIDGRNVLYAAADWTKQEEYVNVYDLGPDSIPATPDDRGIFTIHTVTYPTRLVFYPRIFGANVVFAEVDINSGLGTNYVYGLGPDGLVGTPDDISARKIYIGSGSIVGPPYISENVVTFEVTSSGSQKHYWCPTDQTGSGSCFGSGIQEVVTASTGKKERLIGMGNSQLQTFLWMETSPSGDRDIYYRSGPFEGPVLNGPEDEELLPSLVSGLFVFNDIPLSGGVGSVKVGIAGSLNIKIPVSQAGTRVNGWSRGAHRTVGNNYFIALQDAKGVFVSTLGGRYRIDVPLAPGITQQFVPSVDATSFGSVVVFEGINAQYQRAIYAAKCPNPAS